MPRKAKTICPRCGKASLGRCKDCKRKSWKESDAKRQRTDWGAYKAFYNSAAWHQTREAQLLDEPLCRHCAKVNFLRYATEVDHIVPIREGGDRLNFDNLQSLCRSCHSRKTRDDSRQKKKD